MRSNSLRRNATGARTPLTVAAAVATTTATLILGYVAFGLITMLVFTAGFAGGLLLWLLPNRGSWADLKIPYWIALVLFLAHRVEEKQRGFFAYLSEVTGLPTPAIASVPVVLLLVVSVGAWLLIPVLMTKTPEFGHYLAWAFFTSLGVTELAHFLVFPFLDQPGYGYVPGMWTVLVLAPVAWFGMWRLARGTRPRSPAGHVAA